VGLFFIEISFVEIQGCSNKFLIGLLEIFNFDTIGNKNERIYSYPI